MTGQGDVVPSGGWLSPQVSPSGGGTSSIRRPPTADLPRTRHLSPAARSGTPVLGRGHARCTHTPPCPSTDAADREAARTVARHPEQGWSLLCNGVVLFDDGGEILPTGRALPPPTRPGASPAAGAQAVSVAACQLKHADRPDDPEMGADSEQVGRPELAMAVFELLTQPMKPPPDRCPACAGETRLEGIGHRVCVAACATRVRPKQW